jgi:hypothetical protein
MEFLVSLVTARKRRRHLMKRRPTIIMVPVLFFAGFLWTAEAWGRAEDSGSSGSRSSSRAYSAPVVPSSPEVLCGCTDVLKNFA